MYHAKLTAVLLAAAISAPAAWGHGGSHDQNQAMKVAAIKDAAFGRTGDPEKVIRTINVDMRDEMEFLPNGMNFRQGDTVKFVVRNSGKMMHELVIGTMEELKAHAELMRKHPEMEHEEPWMAHVAPGKTETIVWQFTKPGEFWYACLVPGHFEAGMVGRIRVSPKVAKR